MRLLALLLAASAIAASSGHAAKGPRTQDQVWSRPDFAHLGVQSIAMLPVATYTNDLPAERQVQMAWGQKFAASGYRWISAGTVRDLLRASAEGDSLLKLARESVLQKGHVDSLLAPALCGRLRVGAALSVCVQQWEQTAIEPDQAGKPSTSVQLRAALVDSTGRLLWSASGSETVEGDYHEPTQVDAAHAGSGATRSTGLGGASGPGSGTPPMYAEVLERLLARWVKIFPMKPAADSTRAPGK